MPQFTKPDTTAGDLEVEYTEAQIDTDVPTEFCENHDEVPVGIVVAVTEDYIILQGTCQQCGKETLLKIFNQSNNGN